jgi:hypothetical protein
MTGGDGDEAGVLGDARDLDAVLERDAAAERGLLDGGVLEQHREVGPGLAGDRRLDLADEGGAAVDVAAVAVLAAVEEGAQELVQQLGVAARQLDAVVAGLARPRGDDAEALGEHLDLAGGEDRGVAAVQRAQPHRQAARGQRAARCGRARMAVPALEREQAAVPELDDDLAAGLVHAAGQRGEREHARALADDGHAGRGATLRKHDRVALNDEAEAGLHVRDEVLHVDGGRIRGAAGPLEHRRAVQAVAQGQGPESDRIGDAGGHDAGAFSGSGGFQASAGGRIWARVSSTSASMCRRRA